METKFIVVIEIGSSKIRGAVAEQQENGSLLVKDVCAASMINCVRYGFIQNVESTRIAISNIIHQFETTIDGKITDVYVGINGRTVHNIPLEITHSLMNESSISERMVYELRGEALSRSYAGLDNLDVLPVSYLVDRLEVGNPVGNIGSELRAKMNLVVARTNLKLNAQRVFNELPCNVKRFCVTPLAAGRVLLSKEERSLGAMLIDLGAETTTISIYKKDSLMYICALPIGGRNITRDITALNVLEDTAERIKQTINYPLEPKEAKEIIEGIKSSEVANYISARTGEIIANIKQQRENAKEFVETISCVVVHGGGALLRGLTQKLMEELNVNVRIAKAPNSIQSYDPMTTATDNLNLLSLLVDCANLNESSCVKKNEYSFEMKPTHTTNSVVEAEKEEEKPHTSNPYGQKERGFFNKLKDRLVNVLNDSGEQKEDYYK